MTVALAILTPTHVVFATDSRLTNDPGGSIVSDEAEKFVRTRMKAAVFAGDWADCQAAMAELDEPPKPRKSKSFDSLVYDFATDTLSSVSGDGSAVPVSCYEAIGSGGDTAAGFLRASLPSGVPPTLAQARHVAREALRAACARSSSCGGRLRVRAVPRRRTAKAPVRRRSVTRGRRG